MDGVSEGGIAAETLLQPVEPGYRHVLRLRLLLLWLPLAIAALVFDNGMVAGTPFYGGLSILVPLAATLVVAIAPQRIYRRLRYGLTERLLQVVRGWLFHTDTIVPFVRVQHLDVTRGPLDKLFGTATLVVHTAGTRNSIVTVPGLAPGRAAEIRDVIREHIRTDFE
ncbi:MAG TPA: PH domain-containing protein [Sphingomicrobium sp.]|nr:PH domain-containing protein [Sphingomicrobium sp.]